MWPTRYCSSVSCRRVVMAVAWMALAQAHRDTTGTKCFDASQLASYSHTYQPHFLAWATHVSYTTLASASPSSLPSPTFASPTTPRSSPALTGNVGSNPCNPPLMNHTLLPLPA